MAVRAGRRIRTAGVAAGGAALLLSATGTTAAAATPPQAASRTSDHAPAAPARERGTTADITVTQTGHPVIAQGRRGTITVAFASKKIVSVPADFRFTAPRGIRFVPGERLAWAYQGGRFSGSTSQYEVSPDQRTLSFRENPALWELTGYHSRSDRGSPLAYTLPVRAVPDAPPGRQRGGSARAGSSAVAPLHVTVARAALAGVHFSRIRYNASAPETTNVTGEYVEITNGGRTPVELNRWTVSDAARTRFTFGPHTLVPGQRIRLHSGMGHGTTRAGYVVASGNIWNDAGDTATLRDNRARVVDSCRWRGTGKGATTC